MLKVPTYLAPSNIEGAGIGLFTCNPLRRGDLVWALDDMDVIVDRLPDDPVAASFVDKYGYVPLDGPPRWIICMDNGRFVNHSETPSMVDSADETRAAYDMPAGTELTSDYRTFAKDAFSGWDVP